jgi:hypothetical protein
LNDSVETKIKLVGIGSLQIEMDGEHYNLQVPENCSGREAAHLAHMLAYATIATTALDFKAYIKQHQLERLWVKA